MAIKAIKSWPYNMLTASGTNLTLYPEGTTDENAHLLITESIADDDATYIQTTNTANFMVNIPTKGNIIGIKVYFRAKGSGTLYAAHASLRVAIKNDESTYIHSSELSTSSGNDVWENYVLDFSNQFSFLEAVNSTEYEDYITLWLGYGKNIDDGNSKTSEYTSSSYTQAYVEFIYGPKPICLRKNGVWGMVFGPTYQKVNGIWIEKDNNVFVEGERFNLNLLE